MQLDMSWLCIAASGRAYVNVFEVVLYMSLANKTLSGDWSPRPRTRTSRVRIWFQKCYIIISTTYK